WEVLQVPQPIADLSTQFTALTNALQALQGDTPSLQQFEKLRAAISGVFVTIDVIRSAPDSAIPATLLADDFLTEFPEQVVQHLLVDYLIEYHPRIAYALRLLGLIRIDFVSAAGNRPTYMARRIAWKE